MTVASIRNNVIDAENKVTNALNTYGENSTQYKEALRQFANDWKTFKNHENFISIILED